MPRGGYHADAKRWGRKSAWQNLPTELIRVPANLIDEILEYAHSLDTDVLDSVQKQAILNALDRFIEQERLNYGKNNAQKTSFSTNTARWHYLNKFKGEIESGKHS